MQRTVFSLPKPHPSVFLTLLCITQIFCVLTQAADNTTAISNGTHPSAASHERVGWTSSPNGRGTLDIVWSCVFTLFLCCWSVLCINLPAPTDSTRQIVSRKLWLTGLNVAGPEFLFQIAVGEVLSARRSVKAFHESGYDDWTMTHAFFADMGGFILNTSDYGHFPIDAQQLLYLIKAGHVEYPRISLEKIKDRNKSDGILRAITALQTLYFAVNMAIRASQKLAITCLELTTSAFIVCAIATSICWLRKPADVRTAEIITPFCPVSEILVNSGYRGKVRFGRTPLDFISRKEWEWSIYWSNWIHILRYMKVPFMDFGLKEWPVSRFVNQKSLEVAGRWLAVTAVVALAYFAIFVAGWNYSFPTNIERTLWRAASLTTTTSVPVFVLLAKFGCEWYPLLKQHFRPGVKSLPRPSAHENEGDRSSHSQTTTEDMPESFFKFLQQRFRPDIKHLPVHVKHGSDDGSHGGQSTKRGILQSISRLSRSVAASVRNNSLSQDPALNVPLKAMLPTYIVATLYCFARTYIWISDFIELRSLPPSAYQTVSWSWIVPHF